ncbi:thiol-disulfide isomerase/thioredoxin [Clostridium moniliforme]|uniref:Thiol-disulfide isomerase/thioredoxin n=1 Tax=Clostridium moniliforme TaxID=39489 RepID=A0ABS4F0D0_9CLOT|nr:TlpA disulfide reductase family protein [Clostridium moniliforme]MBP1889701.1 thiol-disulfide isomerase/thioredoxin [Clostridium moniliforme]
MKYAKKIIILIIVILTCVGAYQVYNINNKKLKDDRDIKIENNNGYNNKQNEQSKVSESESKEERDKKYPKAPEFTLTDLKNKKVSLSDYKGKYVMINFWATWCSACKSELPDLEKFYNENKNNKDFKLLTIDVGENKDVVEKFMKENKYNFDVLLDKNTEVSYDYTATALPTTVLIDKEGYIKKIILGAMNKNSMNSYKEMLINNEFK